MVKLELKLAWSSTIEVTSKFTFVFVYYYHDYSDYYDIQWNLPTANTIGTQLCVLYGGVSLIQR